MPGSSCAGITNPIMNPENQAWLRLREHAAAQISPGFAERVLRATRQGAPSLAGAFILSAATAALCLLVVALIERPSHRAVAASNLADWQQIASASEMLADAQ